MRTVLLLVLAASLAAADYPCWRGPDGSGVADSDVKVVDTLKGLKPAWVSADPIPSAGWDITSISYSGGLNNPVVAGDKVFLTYYEMSGDVIDKDVDTMWEKDRRQKRVWPKREDFVHRWKVGADDVVHCFDATTGSTVWKKVFPDTAINYNHRGPGLKTGPHMTPCVADGRLYATGALMALYCFDAATGDIVWQHPVPEKYRKIRDDALARKNVHDMKHYLCNVHLQVVDGVLVVPCGSSLVGYEAATGKEIWRIEGKDLTSGKGVGPVRWTHGDKTFLILGITCVDPVQGAVVWRGGLQGNYLNDYFSTTVSDDHLVVVLKSKDKKTSLASYAIDGAGATPAWTKALEHGLAGGTTPVISSGRVFVNQPGGRRGSPHFLVAYDLTTGEEAGRAGFGVSYNPVYDSLVGGDGLVVKCPVRVPKGLTVFDVRDPTNIRKLGTIEPDERYGWCSTGAWANGRLYFRRWHRLVCYNFRKR